MITRASPKYSVTDCRQAHPLGELGDEGWGDEGWGDGGWEMGGWGMGGWGVGGWGDGGWGEGGGGRGCGLYENIMNVKNTE